MRKKVEVKKEAERLERAGRKMGDTVNVTAFQSSSVSETVHSTAPVAKTKQTTSKSPQRTVSPVKARAEEKKHGGLVMQQSTSDSAAQEKEQERLEIKKYGVRNQSSLILYYRGCSFGKDTITQER